MEKITSIIKHPKELIFFGISKTLERISYYGIRSLLMLYMTSNFLNLSENKSIEIYSYFTIAIMLTPILGAVLGDLKLGNRKASILGILLNIIGTILILIPNQYCLYFSLSLLALGSGFYIPNFNAQLGKYYLDREKLIDGGFTIIYFLINVGAFLGAMIIGYFQNDMMIYGFIIAIFTNLIALFFQLKAKEQSNETKQNISSKQTNWKVILFVIIGVSIYWTANSFIESYYIQTESLATNLEYNPILNFDNLKNIFGILLGLVACFIWTNYYLSSSKKINCVLITLIIAIATILIFKNLNISTNTKSFYPSFLLLSIAEVILAPIIYSVVIRNANTKYIAIILSLTFIPIRLIQEIFNRMQYHFNLTNIFVLTIISLILIPYLVLLFKNKNELDVAKAST